MPVLQKDDIKNRIADSNIIFKRGENLYQHGSYLLVEKNLIKSAFTYKIDGNYGDYVTKVRFTDDDAVFSCTCPYPGDGCKHVVAALLNARDLLVKASNTGSDTAAAPDAKQVPYLSEEEIRSQALNDRKKRARSEAFRLVAGDMIKGDHLVINKQGREYQVTLHDPQAGSGHCTCPDYLTNGLGVCKHIFFALSCLENESGFQKRCQKEKFPFVDIFWNSRTAGPGVFYDPQGELSKGLNHTIDRYFDENGRFYGNDLSQIPDLIDCVDGDKQVRIRENLLMMVEQHAERQQLENICDQELLEYPLKTELYPYQKEGVRFGLYKTGVLIGDEMGLGKTIQAITLGVLKKEYFGFSKILVITLASLKEQWKREITKFTDEKAAIVEGNQIARKQIYFNDTSLFKITNYEAVLRDVTILSRFKPDVIVLDEAQRIKNFSTKTAEAVKRIPKKHGIVLTGTPLENKLEDIYSIVQFLDPFMLAPLWKFAADHFLIPKTRKSSIAGYKNLERLNEKLRRIVIRRKKEAVLKELPAEITNNYYIDLTQEQAEIHSGYARILLPLINKKFLTPMDVRRIQMLLLKMRMVCDSTYLIDRETHLSPKLSELRGVIEEIAVQNKRKIVIFSEWTTMTYLIARVLSDMSLPFVELSGQIPVKKRQALIDEFTNNPDCRIFLSTDAGGTGLNLQAADCVINFELPWNPARLNQRIGRVSRIGQESSSINVINFIAKNSIEEKILAGIQLKTDLFKGVFDDGPDVVEFTREKRDEMLNRLRQMMGEVPEIVEMEPAGFVEPEEIPEDTPYYLNPEVLNPKQEAIDGSSQDAKDDPGSAGHLFADQPSEKIETVLNSGMQFLTGLMEMATGQKMEPASGQDRMIRIDRDTGEITLKFKLPS